jgi:hypothetical protein
MRHGALAALRRPDRVGLRGWLADPSFGDRFGPVSQSFFPNSTRHDADTLLGLVQSRSYYLTSSRERQMELERQVRELVAEHPDLAGRAEFDLQYVTVVFRTQRVAN